MQAIVDAFNWLINIIKTLIDFVFDLVEGAVLVAQLLGNFLANLSTYISFLPASVVVSVITIFSIAVIYKLAGRD